MRRDRVRVVDCRTYGLFTLSGSYCRKAHERAGLHSRCGHGRRRVSRATSYGLFRTPTTFGTSFYGRSPKEASSENEDPFFCWIVLAYKFLVGRQGMDRRSLRFKSAYRNLGASLDNGYLSYS